MFWLLSYGLALPAYYLLYEVLPNGYVFGMYFRMYLYHYQFPGQYIAIPCLVFGILATHWSNNFYRASSYGKLLWAGFIMGMAILISCPFGGMLWHLHDMMAGFFPEGWPLVLIGKGGLLGLKYGWLIIALSFPYNVLGIVAGYMIIRTVSSMFRPR